MIEPDTRVEHLMAAAITKWGVSAVLEQVFVHVTFSARYGPPSLFDDVMKAGEQLKCALQAVRNLEDMERQHEE